MRRHWIHKIFMKDSSDIMIPMPSATVYITNAHEDLIDHPYAYKEGSSVLANPTLCDERGVLEFWTEKEVDFLMLVVYLPGFLPTWFTWLHGCDPSYVDSGYSVIERICELNGIEL